MRKKPAIASLALLLFCVPAVLRVQARPQDPAKTVLDGVYSDQQAVRGKALYTTHCSACHGNAMEGVSAPELTGNRFIERWREGMLDGMYTFIRDRMPFGRPASAARIPDNDYLDIVTYVLKVNGYRTGESDLTTALVGNVMFVGVNGPRPVPDGSLIVTVGCLSEGPNDSWLLLKSTEPTRTRNSTASTPAELKASTQRSLGTLTFRLADLEAVPDFMPAAHKGHKMQAKGFLVRQPNAERISLSAMDMLDTACGQ